METLAGITAEYAKSSLRPAPPSTRHPQKGGMPWQWLGTDVQFLSTCRFVSQLLAELSRNLPSSTGHCLRTPLPRRRGHWWPSPPPADPPPTPHQEGLPWETMECTKRARNLRRILGYTAFFPAWRRGGGGGWHKALMVGSGGAGGIAVTEGPNQLRQMAGKCVCFFLGRGFMSRP